MPITIAIIISIGIEAAEAAAVAAFPEEAPAARLDFSAVPPAVSTVFLPASCAVPCAAVVAFPDASVALPLAAACDPALPAALLPCLFLYYCIDSGRNLYGRAYLKAVDFALDHPDNLHHQKIMPYMYSFQKKLFHQFCSIDLISTYIARSSISLM